MKKKKIIIIVLIIVAIIILVPVGIIASVIIGDTIDEKKAEKWHITSIVNSLPDEINAYDENGNIYATIKITDVKDAKSNFFYLSFDLVGEFTYLNKEKAAEFGGVWIGIVPYDESEEIILGSDYDERGYFTYGAIDTSSDTFNLNVVLSPLQETTDGNLLSLIHFKNDDMRWVSSIEFVDFDVRDPQ